MELIASVSRSSGLEKDGDALRDARVQEEYRTFIQGKLDDYWKRYPLSSYADLGSEDADAARSRKENQENLLILLRKLREGLLSIKRKDAFALEVYETSLYLAVLFKSPVQTTSALSHIFPDLYISIASQSAQPPASASASSATKPSRVISDREKSLSTSLRTEKGPEVSLPGSALATTLIFLLHHLVTTYPSQVAFHTQVRQLHPALQAVLGTPIFDPTSRLPAEAALSEPLAPPSISKLKLNVDTPSETGPHLGSKESKPKPAIEATTKTKTNPAAASGRQPPAAPSPLSNTASPSSRAPAAPRVSHPPRPASARDWLRELARCLRTRNYARLEGLTRREVFGGFIHVNFAELDTDTSGRGQLIEAIDPIDSKGGATPSYEDLALEAIGVLVESLLEKARGVTWNVLRTAYREVSLSATPSAPAHDTGTTGDWLGRSLVLRACAPRTTGPDGASVRHAAIEAWLDERCRRGEARRKQGEGMDGRWILVKA
ncbi:hypothetical protein DICSQDRAFT_145501 [Dichomitus squalens LYAD-421 SS1]|uniref:uncharacterized protein n=1 Tax=Dichomitus squalens (strain LYAD-421) TaxID=732165 RepID=UPI0004415F77|nr:uncharacterized protein DICSQDRAFT_145501 [Dichomitus squalens LYAD-421 SS1]EJF63242.1 hypothetical protein DICSQDRAFT_145501 [Dichomitus squalens LYAD-421 SS1]